jgi:hypothetical protein
MLRIVWGFSQLGFDAFYPTARHNDSNGANRLPTDDKQYFNAL